MLDTAVWDPPSITCMGESSHTSGQPCQTPLVPVASSLCIVSRGWSHLGSCRAPRFPPLLSSPLLSNVPIPGAPWVTLLLHPVLSAASPAHTAPAALSQCQGRARLTSLTCWLSQPRELLACPAAEAHRCHVSCLSLRPSDNAAA